MESDMRIVEIGGIKMEVDMRQCKVIENYKVGDQIKVLVQKYTNEYQTYPGVIIGFDAFENLPSLCIAYLESDYSGADVKFMTYNNKTDKVEIAPLNKLDRYFSRAEAIEKLDKKIAVKKLELDELEQKKKFFESNFSKYFEEITV